MALLNIVKVPNDLLHKASKPVLKFDENLWTLLDDMEETMRTARGIGLAAVQVGYLLRACLVELEDGEVLELINPQVLSTKGKKRKGTEGCLSIPGVAIRVERFRNIRIRFQDRHGNWQECNLEEISAICAQHEIDHLDGKLITDWE